MGDKEAVVKEIKYVVPKHMMVKLLSEKAEIEARSMQFNVYTQAIVDMLNVPKGWLLNWQTGEFEEQKKEEAKKE